MLPPASCLTSYQQSKLTHWDLMSKNILSSTILACIMSCPPSCHDTDLLSPYLAGDGEEERKGGTPYLAEYSRDLVCFLHLSLCLGLKAFFAEQPYSHL